METVTRKDCFDFCSEVFGEMRHLTEEEKKLYEDMLDRLSENTSVFDRKMLGTWDEAIEYCETHECKDCIAHDVPDRRTEYEKESLHVPCCINLLDEDLWYV